MGKNESRREWLNKVLAGSTVAALGGTTACKKAPEATWLPSFMPGVASSRLLIICHGMMGFEFKPDPVPDNSLLYIHMPLVPQNGSDPGHVYRAGNRQPQANPYAIDDKNSPYKLSGPQPSTYIPPEVYNVPNVKLLATGKCHTSLQGTPAYCKIQIPMPEFYLGCRLSHDPEGLVFDTGTTGTVTDCGLFQVERYASVHVFGYSSVGPTVLSKANGDPHWSSASGGILHLHAEPEQPMNDNTGAHLPHLNELFTQLKNGSLSALDLKFRNPAKLAQLGEKPPKDIVCEDLASLAEVCGQTAGNPTNCMDYFLLPG
jgi:hypothetical protein